MTVLRMDNVGIVVEDLDAAIAFFVELGLELEGRMPIEDEWAARVVGLAGARSEVAMVRTPDGNGKLELMRYRHPAAVGAGQRPPVNTLGLHRVMFTVDGLEDVLARLRTHGAELVGEVVRFQDMFLICYVRGPEGIIVALAEQLR